MAKLSPQRIERRANPTEIIRCLLHDGFTLEGAVTYCRSIALQARYNAYAVQGDADAYAEAADRLEARAKAEKVALENVEQLEALCDSQSTLISELQKNIVSLMEQLEQLTKDKK